jgi:DNA-binding response OmpR family regulator
MREQPTTIAILGTNTVVENALAQLLEGEGYATTVLKTFPMEEALVEEMPFVDGGADLVVLAPSLSSGECDIVLAARRTTQQRTTPSSLPMPVIVLRTPMKEAPALPETEEGAARIVAWPTTREHLVREIEEVLLESRSPAHKERNHRSRSRREGGVRR